MSKIAYYIQIFLHIFVLRSKFLFLIVSFFFLFFLKFFRKKDYSEYNNFFKNFSLNQNKTNNEKICIHINFYSWLDIQNTIFSFLVVNLIGLRNKNILYFKTSFLKFVNSKNIFIFELPLNYYSKLSFFYLNTLSNRLLKSSYDEIFNYKYKNIQCGKYSISSAIRILRTPEINLKNRRHYIVVKFFLIKSIMLADASINYLNKNKKIEYAVFNDKSYVGAGELFDQCIHNKIKCIQFVASYKNNIILLKKFDESNQNHHPSSISQEIWNKFKLDNLSFKQKNFLKSEIKSQYENNTWYPSAGTMVGKKFLDLDSLSNQLNLDRDKKTAIIFPHIFWDGTFFFGKDLFKNYIDWYRETLRAANENKNLNWIIKSHPSNIIKNNRDNISNNKEEPELTIIKELFDNVPNHFRYIGSNSKINTFQLFDFLDYCFTIRGTVGIEAALKNKIVVTAGTGRYDNRDFTYNFNNKINYFKFISNLHNFKHTKKNVVKNAEKFAYIAFICKTFELNSANFFFKKDNLANLNLEIDYNKINSDVKFNNSIKELHNWIDGKYSDYFKDPIDEWKIL